MANIVYRQMPAPQELLQQIPAPRAKAWMQKPQGGGKFLVQVPGVRGRGMVMDEIDTCITGGQFSQKYCPVSKYFRKIMQGMSNIIVQVTFYIDGDFNNSNIIFQVMFYLD